MEWLPTGNYPAFGKQFTCITGGFHGNSKQFLPHGFYRIMLFKLRSCFSQFDCRQFRYLNRFSGSVNSVDISFNNGNRLSIESGRFARFSDGSTTASIGKTNVLVAAVSKTKPTPSSIIPLTVDYRQKAASVGKIPTNFLRRELGPTEKEILTGRLIDRSIRPLFPPGYYYETQLFCDLLSSDGVNDPDVIAVNAASAALTLSDIPWAGPIGAVRVAFSEGSDIIINPTRNEVESSDFNMIVCSNEHARILMIEGYANIIGRTQDLVRALKQAVDANLEIIKGIKQLKEHFPIEKRTVEKYFVPTKAQLEATHLLASAKIEDILTTFDHDKISRDVALREVQNHVFEAMKESFPEEDPIVIADAFSKTLKSVFAKVVTESGRRMDGRGYTDLRNISCSTGLFKTLHGSALFQRGQTQVLSTLALDSLQSALKADPVTVMTGGLKEKNFMLHYEFPSFATNETGRVGVFGRREIGHGALAEKALRPSMPADFPFTTRLNCEVLESNGSSSMASVCVGSLALMDGGIPITHPTSGVALGLIYSFKGKDEDQSLPEDEKFIILTDILGIEDFLGGMDLKMAGTNSGLTAIHLDCKLSYGLPIRVIEDTLAQGLEANHKILEIMKSTISQPNDSSRENWPIVETIDIPPHRRSRVFSSGSSAIRKLTVNHGINLRQDDGDPNKLILFAPDKNAYKIAKSVIDELLTMDDYEKKLEFKAIYVAKVVDVVDTGVKVILFPGMDPVFIPNRELDQKQIKHPSVLGLIVGSEFKVKYFGRDPSSGQMRLTRRVLQALDPVGGNYLKNTQKD